LTLGQAFEVAYQLALSVRKEGNESRRHIRSKSANQLSTNISIPDTNSRSYGGENDSFHSANNKQHQLRQHQQHSRSHSVTDLPPIPLSIPTPQPTPNSHHILKDQKLPRAESFSFTTQTAKVHQLFSRAPIVSKEEL